MAKLLYNLILILDYFTQYFFNFRVINPSRRSISSLKYWDANIQNMQNDYQITESRKKHKNVISNYIFSNFYFFPKKKIKTLEVGSGFGYTLKYIVTEIKKKVKDKKYVLVGKNIKLKKLFFDLTFTHGLFCFFKSEKKFVSALNRVLRITKVLILCEPDYSEPMSFLEYLKFKKERNYKRFDYQNIFLINKIKCDRIFFI